MSVDEYFVREPWHLKALCSGGGQMSSLMYPERSNVAVGEAKKLCNGNPQEDIAPCPVKNQCLKYALEHNERFGVWGGTSERERRKMQRKRRAALKLAG